MIKTKRYSTEQLLDVINGWYTVIKRDGAQYPSAVLSDLEKSIQYVLEKNGRYAPAAVIGVLNKVDMVLNEHPPMFVDVVKNDLTGMLDIMYHSTHNSFLIEGAVANPGDWSQEDYKLLIDGLDFRSVGYCF